MRILKPFMLLAVIGVLYSCAAVPLQTYRNGYIMDKNNVVVGYYSNGHVLDLEKNIIGYYANGYIYDTRHEVIGNYVNGYIKNLKSHGLFPRILSDEADGDALSILVSQVLPGSFLFV